MKEALYFGLEYSPIKLDPKLPNPTVIPCRIFAINNSRKDEDNVNKIHEHIIIIELSRKENLRPMYFMIIQVIIDPMNMNNPRTDANHDSESLFSGISFVFLNDVIKEALNPNAKPYEIILKVTLEITRHCFKNGVFHRLIRHIFAR